MIIFSHGSETGLEIPYPAVSIHAIKSFQPLDNNPAATTHKFLGVYMQLQLSDGAADDDDRCDPIELTLIPCKRVPPDESDLSGAAVDPLNPERTNALFNQISACSNLHPDPNDSEGDGGGDQAERIVPEESNVEHEALDGFTGVLRGDSAGGLPPPMPGSSGWITAENVHEYFDGEGNFIGQSGSSGELGEGAGRVRDRDEVDGDGANGYDEDNDPEAKRARTDAGEGGPEGNSSAGA